MELESDLAKELFNKVILPIQAKNIDSKKTYQNNPVKQDNTEQEKPHREALLRLNKRHQRDIKETQKEMKRKEELEKRREEEQKRREELENLNKITESEQASAALPPPVSSVLEKASAPVSSALEKASAPVELSKQSVKEVSPILPPTPPNEDNKCQAVERDIIPSEDCNPNKRKPTHKARLRFHPDRNFQCQTEAGEKFKELQNICGKYKPAQEPAQETTQEPAQETTQEPAQETTQEPAQETTQEPAIKAPEPPAIKAPEPPAIKALVPPAIKAPEPPAIKAPEPPAIKAPEPPAIKAPEPPAIKALVPPAIKAPEPPAIKAPEPPAIKAPEPPAIKAPEPEVNKETLLSENNIDNLLTILRKALSQEQDDKAGVILQSGDIHTVNPINTIPDVVEPSSTATTTPATPSSLPATTATTTPAPAPAPAPAPGPAPAPVPAVVTSCDDEDCQEPINTSQSQQVSPESQQDISLTPPDLSEEESIASLTQKIPELNIGDKMSWISQALAALFSTIGNLFTFEPVQDNDPYVNEEKEREGYVYVGKMYMKPEDETKRPEKVKYINYNPTEKDFYIDEREEVKE